MIEPEHRFFGSSLPVAPYDTAHLALLTPDQALADTAALIENARAVRGCSGRNGEPRCPVITVGGSYPGWLSAMMRLRYPAVVDMSWAASAPMRFYSQNVDQYAYYAVVTESADKAVPGCAAAVRGVLARTLAVATKDAIISGLDLCAPLPPYLAAGSAALLVEEISMVVMYSFANLNMANWPPPNTSLKAACEAIVAGAEGDAWATLAAFLKGYSGLHAGAGAGCYNVSSQLPAGPHATISAGDCALADASARPSTRPSTLRVRACVSILRARSLTRPLPFPRRVGRWLGPGRRLVGFRDVHTARRADRHKQ